MSPILFGTSRPPKNMPFYKLLVLHQPHVSFILLFIFGILVSKNTGIFLSFLTKYVKFEWKKWGNIRKGE